MMRNSLAALAFGVLAALAGPAGAAPVCTDMAYQGTSYAVCTARAGDEVRLFLTTPSGENIGNFDRLEDALAAEGKRLRFAMNAGMYHPDRRPVGLYIEDGEKRAGLVSRPGPGNFGMVPNGVFCVTAAGFRVIETQAYKAKPPTCRFATQSGPMLVIDGRLHPRFSATSTSRYIRNGVGVSRDRKTAWFVISDRPVTFHAFASFFRDKLKSPNALYFDGNVSRLFAPDLGREDGGFAMGPMLGLVTSGG